MQDVLRTYLIAQVPGWGLAAIALWGLQHWAIVSTGLAASLLALWIAKDLLLFPKMRRFFESEPAERRMVGERGTAVTVVGTEGLVRVRGELWQARCEQRILPETVVLVRDVQGLTLVVAPASGAAAPRADSK
jgi:membrane protein implicated in regulation of membrane protease activity